MQFNKINSIEDLYKELNFLYKGIYNFCKVCKEEDCKGYVLLLPEEAQKLSSRVPLVEINQKLYFLDSFIRENKEIKVDKTKPPCVLNKRNNKKCSIYPMRPLICRLYPLDFRILKGEIYIVVHTDCLYIQRLISTKTIPQFLEKVLNVFYSCNRELLRTILEYYQEINSIFEYPEDYKHNDYFRFLKVVKLKQGIKLKLCQSAKQFLTLKR